MPGLDRLFATETVSAYIGFDATASSLHAGSLIQIMMLHWLQQTGHRPIALMGGGTTMIGDPSVQGRGAQAADGRGYRAATSPASSAIFTNLSRLRQRPDATP